MTPTAAEQRTLVIGELHPGVEQRCSIPPIGTGVTERQSSDYDRGKLQDRHAKLAGGVAAIKVGGASLLITTEPMIAERP